MAHTIHHGDCIAVMRTMDAASVQCVVTSPPYWGLRDYKVDGMIGLEETLDEYLAKMLDVFREVKRVMRPDGTLWLNLGDAYAGGGRGGNPNESAHRKQASNQGSLVMPSPIPQGLKPKDLCGIPWRVALALQADGWWLRSDIIWHKPNPMPESVTDRPTKSHEYMFLLTPSARYFYDAEAVRTPLVYGANTSSAPQGDWNARRAGEEKVDGKWSRTKPPTRKPGYMGPDAGANLRDVWTIPTEAFPGAHFATFPRKLVEPCLKAGTSAKGCCPECGTPWRRLVNKHRVPTRPGIDNVIDDTGMANRDAGRHVTETKTVGWKPGCICNAGEPVPCTVFDPFAGSGTVGVVAKQMGLEFIGIELNPDYAGMARKRIANPEPEPMIVDVEGQLTLFEESPSCVG